jgi:hypothetical protein
VLNPIMANTPLPEASLHQLISFVADLLRELVLLTPKIFNEYE